MKQQLLKKNNAFLIRLTILIIALISTSIAFAQGDLTADQWDKITETTPSAPPADGNSADKNDESPFSEAQPGVQESQPSGDNTKTEPTPNTESTSLSPDISTPTNNFTTGVSLQGLNKITARTSTLEVKSGEPIKFGNLSIIFHACWKSPPEEAQESKALLEMWEEIPGESRKKVFKGWMFSSSPLISAPEHPVYDITVLECTGEPVKIAVEKVEVKTGK